MLQRLRQKLALVASRISRLWRLGDCRVIGYRLRTADGARSIARVIDTQIIGDHLHLTDIDGLTYIVALSQVHALMPIEVPSAASLMRPLQVVG